MKFFACCSKCGSTEWIQLGVSEFIKSVPNSLTEEGDIMVNNNINQLSALFDKLICTDCESKIKPIPFKNVSKQIRKKIYFMSNDRKINWVKGYLLADKISRSLNGKRIL